jgi:hypothetical protein
VTRRPVQGEVVAPQAVVPAIVPAPAIVQTVPNTVDAITTREVVRSAEARELVTRPVAARRRPARHVAHARNAHRTTRAARPVRTVALNPRERHIVYQTIVEREVMPRRQVIVAPPVVQQPLFQAPVVAADEVGPAPIALGTVLPENVPLYAIPENVALGVPATQSYSYAWLGGRAYLVDPGTGTVVADVTE